MAATIEWKVEGLDCYPTKDGKTDVVMMVHWRCNGSEENDSKTYRSTSYSAVDVTYKDGDNFTPFADLTENQVLGWVWESVDKNETEANIQKMIDDQRDPPITRLALPWA